MRFFEKKNNPQVDPTPTEFMQKLVDGRIPANIFGWSRKEGEGKFAVKSLQSRVGGGRRDNLKDFICSTSFNVNYDEI